MVSENLERGKSWPQYLVAITCFIAIFNSSIHFGWPSPGLPKLMSEEYPFEVSGEDGSYIAIAGPVGSVIGSVLFPAVVDRLGRRTTILLIALPQILSMVFLYLSFYLYPLIFLGRIIGGLGESGCFTILPLYISEIAEPRLRGRLGGIFTFVMIFGLLSVNVIGSYLSLQASTIVFAIFPLIFLISFWRMPESPYYCIMKNNLKQAESSLKKLRGRQDVEQELKGLVTDVQRQMSEKGTFTDLFTITANRKAFFIMLGLRLVQQFTGISAFTQYMQIMFSKSTDAIPKDIASLITFGIEMVFNFVPILLVDRLGRRPLLLFSAFSCFLLLTLEGIYFTLRDYTDIYVEHVSYLTLIGIVLFIIVFAVGLGNVINMMAGELFSSTVKAKAGSILNIVYGLCMIGSSKFFQYTSDNYSLAISYFSFGICVFAGFLFIYFCTPETKGKTLEQIQEALRGKGRFESRKRLDSCSQ